MTYTLDFDWILRKYRDHSSTRLIVNSHNGHTFSFSNVTSNQVHRVILNLNPKKSVTGSIPQKVLRMVSDIISSPIASCLNTSLNLGKSPDILRLAEVSPIFKKGDKFLKENYRLISVLPSLSKVYERIIFNQLSGYFDGILHFQLCSFRSKHYTQQECFE